MDRRSQTDRRRRPTTLLSILRWGGRRRGPRRDGESATYIDCALISTSALTLFIVAASGLDALFTLVHLQGGATEANPVMQLALDHGVGYFLAAKVGVTAFGAWFLAAHQLFGLGFKGLRILAISYCALLAYHVAIFCVR